MASPNEIPLKGGMMNVPVKIGERVHRPRNGSSETTQRLLRHLRDKGLEWVPDPFGFDDQGREVVSYIEGDVPHEMPEWLWTEDALSDVARAMRQLHDATIDFPRRAAPSARRTFRMRTACPTTSNSTSVLGNRPSFSRISTGIVT